MKMDRLLNKEKIDILKAMDLKKISIQEQKQWDDMLNMWESDKYQQMYFDDFNKMADAVDDYYDNHFGDDRYFNKASKLAYDYGYKTGKAAGKDIVKKHGEEAVHNLINNSEYSNVAPTANAVERFARFSAEWERDHM